MQPTKLSVPYLAGLFDGEGSVSLRDYQAKQFQATISVAQNPGPHRILERILREYPGGRIVPNKSCQKLFWNGTLARPFVEAILPYSIIKHRQLECYLEFLDLGGPYYAGSTSREERLVLIEEVQALIHPDRRHKP
jgi:hypothetical protein